MEPQPVTTLPLSDIMWNDLQSRGILSHLAPFLTKEDYDARELWEIAMLSWDDLKSYFDLEFGA